MGGLKNVGQNSLFRGIRDMNPCSKPTMLSRTHKKADSSTRATERGLISTTPMPSIVSFHLESRGLIVSSQTCSAYRRIHSSKKASSSSLVGAQISQANATPKSSLRCSRIVDLMQTQSIAIEPKLDRGMGFAGAMSANILN